MKVATIDIGTNSMRLLLADYENENIVSNKKVAKVTKIGRGVDQNKLLSEQAINENVNVLEEFVKTAKQNKAEKIAVMATSALRDAKNSEEFLEKAYERTGIRVTILSGDMEAKLGFMGIKSLLDPHDYSLTVDIGGGSTEFIVGDVTGEIIFAKSENIGCVRLTEKFLKSDPPTDFEISCMTDYMNQVFEDTFEVIRKYKISQVIGIGGTFTSLSSMLQHLEVYNPLKVHKSKLYIDDVVSLYDELAAMPLSYKQTIVGLQAKRADVIFAGVAIIKCIMQHLGTNVVTVSEFDNLEGLIFEIMK
ncbi:Ppx/GppA phosphatase family protein [Criibacterium bergeronii]|uniref:Ppx/GppA family phosphatase n=1 Tax=Criibacterium bergeronii TaxID=1871336 RepID=A0A371IJJ7_9FIRM|nr:Ppx/GppA phosphatase family protein [Criibacterium bergeronii]RDY20655.1 Ppx/GppA family phosphatase [Criibacterium bergeronii]TRW27054.1 Ppx/GppA family phosphatase [Criibacterium bergeronii]